MEQRTDLAQHLTPGTRVEWRREMYRKPYAQRPIDSGIVVENAGDGFVTVRDEATGTNVRGPWSCFSLVRAA